MEVVAVVKPSRISAHFVHRILANKTGKFSHKLAEGFKLVELALCFLPSNRDERPAVVETIQSIFCFEEILQLAFTMLHNDSPPPGLEKTYWH